MSRFIVHQAVKPEEMKEKEPRKTKSLAFISDKTNVYLALIQGEGLALLHCDSRFPGKSWDGFILDKNSDKLIDELIESFQWVKKNKKILFPD